MLVHEVFTVWSRVLAEETKSGSDAPEQKNDAGPQKPRSKLPLIIAGVLLVIAIIAGLIYWLVTRNEVTTDDAYTDGRSVSIATNTSGYVTQLLVNDNQFVRAGQ